MTRIKLGDLLFEELKVFKYVQVTQKWVEIKADPTHKVDSNLSLLALENYAKRLT